MKIGFLMKLPTDYVGIIDKTDSYWIFDVRKFKEESCGDFGR